MYSILDTVLAHWSPGRLKKTKTDAREGKAIAQRHCLSSRASIIQKNSYTQSMATILLAAILVGSLMGCSVTSLRCGVDGDSSYVELVSSPQSISQNSRTLAELCSFSYQEENNA